MSDASAAAAKAARGVRRRFASRLAIYGGAAAAVTVAHALIH
jgi:hypothetical protein